LTSKRETGRGRVRRRTITSKAPGLAGGWGVHDNNVENLERAIVERVFCVRGEDGNLQRPPRPGRDVKLALQPFTQRFYRHFRRGEPLTTEQFVDSYTGRKRKLYNRMTEELDLQPFEPKDSYVSAFIKDEKTDFIKKPNACARVIQPRHPRFNVKVGVFLKPFEKAAFNAIAGVFRGTTVAKGLNNRQRGELMAKKWSRFVNPVAIMLDASRFDQHCSSDIRDWLFMVEEHFYPELKYYNKLRRKNKCFARTDDGCVKYTVLGNTMSGDMDTASGNCLIMCAVTWTVMSEMGIRCEYINDGDDGVLIVEADQVERVRTEFQRRFLDFGFTMRWDGEARTLEEVEFCQSRPVTDGSGWRMVRDPRVAMAKDAITLKRINRPKDLTRLQSSTGWCGLALVGDMPIYWKYYTLFGQPERPEEFTSGMHYATVNLMEGSSKPPTDEARISFWKAFGISPDKQIVLEEYLSTLDKFEGMPVPRALERDNYIHILTTL